VLGKKGPPSGSGDFASPLFGLASAPNGDILVADAGAGISNVNGGTEITLPGVTDIGPIGRSTMWATRAGTNTEEDTGQGLYRVSQGQNRLIANLFAFEEANDPDGMGVDSNPFAVESLGGRTALVVDAGANTLLRVDNQGHIEVVAIFPNEVVSTANVNELAGCPPENPLCFVPAPAIPAQAVPTSIAVGPDGAMYVGELKGFPAPTNESNIWRIEPGTTGADCAVSPACTKVFDGGFTSVIDLAFGPDGRLYVSEMDEASWAAVEIFGIVTGGTVNACDLDTLVCEEVATGVPIHTAIAFDRSGTLWAIRNALIPGSAEVVPNP
jgi:sugar lactone lactonase YvrE